MNNKTSLENSMIFEDLEKVSKVDKVKHFLVCKF